LSELPPPTSSRQPAWILSRVSFVAPVLGCVHFYLPYDLSFLLVFCTACC
jgi:hypothetical protein